MLLNELTVKQIKAKVKQMSLKEKVEQIVKLENDSRKSVQRIANKIKREKEKVDQEVKRVQAMRSFDNNRASGYKFIAGLDEVGRGPLAGPVVSAAVILDQETIIMGVKDSKKLSLEKREFLFDKIMEEALAVGIGIVPPEVIDEINILEATKLAMKKAVDALEIKPQKLLIDALTIDDIAIEQEGIIKGDNQSLSIAASSIIAKVTRDNIMYDYHDQYPAYGFQTNVGYGTQEHRTALKNQGATPIHRKTFIQNLL